MAQEEPCVKFGPDYAGMNDVLWVRQIGLIKHPEWYPELPYPASNREIASVLYKHGIQTCLRPCDPGEEEGHFVPAAQAPVYADSEGWLTSTSRTETGTRTRTGTIIGTISGTVTETSTSATTQTWTSVTTTTVTIPPPTTVTVPPPGQMADTMVEATASHQTALEASTQVQSTEQTSGPPATEPATTPATEPATTEPPATEPPTTEPPATQLPTTQPPTTEPPTTVPPTTEPPTTEPPTTEPPTTEPPTTEPQTTIQPATQVPAATEPATGATTKPPATAQSSSTQHPTGAPTSKPATPTGTTSSEVCFNSGKTMVPMDAVGVVPVSTDSIKECQAHCQSAKADADVGHFLYYEVFRTCHCPPLAASESVSGPEFVSGPLTCEVVLDDATIELPASGSFVTRAPIVTSLGALAAAVAAAAGVFSLRRHPLAPARSPDSEALLDEESRGLEFTRTSWPDSDSNVE